MDLYILIIRKGLFIMPKVYLLAHTPNPEHTVAAAAKLCYSSSKVSELASNLTEEKAAAFVDMLSEIGHESPIEHASFTFGIEGVSRSLLAQITRHRMASFSVKSQRYVREGSFEYITPPEIAAEPEALALYEEIMAGENMQKYSVAAAAMEEMAQYISGMIGLFFDGQDPETCEIPKADACTHNCSTCGGCH